ncbi:MAG: ABC transporter substrate-binding protein [Cetobacterium sp.]
MKKIGYMLLFIFTFSINIFSSTINIAQEGDAKTFDPHFGNDGFSLRINRLIYSRLLEKNYKMETVSGLAETYKFIDNQNVDFTLKKNIFFQNGEKLTSEDVKYSFERMKKSPRIAAFLPPIKEIVIKDEYSFRMVLEKPFSMILDQLTHPALSIVSKKQLEANPDALIETPIGSGKYTLKSWTPGEGLVLNRFENYFDSKPSYSTINVKTIPLATNRTIALETGEVDLAFSLPPQDKVIIENNPDLKFLSTPSYSYTYLGLNLTSEVFSDENIRRGISYAVDKEAIVNAVLNGNGKIANSPVAPGVAGYNPNTKNLEYNKDEAMKYLESLKGTTLTLAVMNSGIDIQTAQIVAGYLKEIGIDITIAILEPSVYWLKTNAGEFDMFIGSWGSVTGDADYALYPTHHTKSFGPSGNRTFFSDQRVDQLLDLARATLDKKERDIIYNQIQEIIVNKNSEVMLFYRDLNGAINTKIEGFNLYPIPIHDYSSGSIY